LVATILWTWTALPATASAFVDELGSRAVGMGGAGRADARGDEAIPLNPSGMSVARLYSVEGHYQYVSPGGEQFGHVSVVDSTSPSGISGGLYYVFRTAAMTGVSRSTGNEGGIALSTPLGDVVMLGVTGKYLRLSGGAPEPDGSNAHGGITVDAGATIRPASILTLGVVGYSLRDLSTTRAPLALGYGAAVSPVPQLTAALDVFHDFTTSDPTRGVRTTLAIGAELRPAERMALRAGGGRDGGLEHDYVSAGFAAVSEAGALDFGLRQDITGSGKTTTFVASLRVFVPQP
jgi:hypothetical protein